MNQNTPESADDESINPQAQSWAEAQISYVNNYAPSSLKEGLIDRIKVFVEHGANPSQEVLEQQNLEVLVRNARTLNEAINGYTNRMKPLMPSNVLKDDISNFWDNFDFDQLETNALQKILAELVEKVKASEAEVKDKKETSSSVESLIEGQKLTPYFTTRERERIYKQYKRIREAANLNQDQKDGQENDLQLKIAQETIKRQAFKDKKLDLIARRKTDVAYSERQFSLLQRKCGERVFELTEVKALHDEVMTAKEAEADLKTAHADFEAAIASYTERVGQAPPKNILRFAPPSANKNEAPVAEEPETEKTKETVTESYESAEMKIRVITDLRAEAENAAKHWAKMAQDRQHARRGVGTTLWLLEGGAIDGYTREAYEKEFKNARDLPFSKPYQASTGRKIPQVFYDLPTNADAFSADMASGTAAMIKNARENLSEKGRAAASLFYNDYYKDKDPNTIAPSIHEFIGSCNAMIHQLKGGREVEVPQAA